MVRNSEILTLSIPKEQGEFIELLNLSPSKIFQQKIHELQEFHKGSLAYNKVIEALKMSLGSQNQDFADFLEELGVPYEKFNHFKYAKQKRVNGIN